MEENIKRKFILFKRENAITIVTCIYTAIFSIIFLYFSDDKTTLAKIYKNYNLHFVITILCLFILTCIIPICLGILYKNDGTYIYSLLSIIFLVSVMLTPIGLLLKGDYITPFGYTYLVIATGLCYNLVIFISSFMLRIG